jgi:hypothetical protein
MMVEETLSSVNKPKVSEKCIMKYFVTVTFCLCSRNMFILSRIKRPGLDLSIFGQLLTFRNG